MGLRTLHVVAQEGQSLNPGTYVEFRVTDEGTGIDADVLPQLFDPFFTTKGESGTGLGLATCSSVASQLGGSIEVETAPGKGTTFRVLLPASTSAPAAEMPEPSVRASVRRVLVVDDERPVRETTARMLQASGYDVITAATLTDARGMVDDVSLEFEALITDVVLSGERGTDLLEQCRRARPKIRIVVMSGFSPDPTAAAALSKYDAAFLPKPFRRDQLLRTLKG